MMRVFILFIILYIVSNLTYYNHIQYSDTTQCSPSSAFYQELTQSSSYVHTCTSFSIYGHDITYRTSDPVLVFPNAFVISTYMVLGYKKTNLYTMVAKRLDYCSPWSSSKWVIYTCSDEKVSTIFFSDSKCSTQISNTTSTLNSVLLLHSIGLSQVYCTSKKN